MDVTRSKLLAVGLAALLVLAGCTGAPGTAGDSSATDTPETTTQTTETTSQATSQTTQTTEEPEKGDNLLQVSAIDNATAMEFAPAYRATYENLTAEQRAVFDEARTCDCSVNQTVFEFNDKERIRAVLYDGQWYFLRVVVV